MPHIGQPLPPLPNAGTPLPPHPSQNGAGGQASQSSQSTMQQFVHNLTMSAKASKTDSARIPMSVSTLITVVESISIMTSFGMSALQALITLEAQEAQTPFSSNMHGLATRQAIALFRKSFELEPIPIAIRKLIGGLTGIISSVLFEEGAHKSAFEVASVLLHAQDRWLHGEATLDAEAISVVHALISDASMDPASIMNFLSITPSNEESFHMKLRKILLGIINALDARSKGLSHKIKFDCLSSVDATRILGAMASHLSYRINGDPLIEKVFPEIVRAIQEERLIK
jgi:hypothetical protein